MSAPAGFLARAAIAGALLLVVSPVLALDGEVRMHDPSTVVQAQGKFYVYATGAGLPRSSRTTAGRGGAPDR